MHPLVVTPPAIWLGSVHTPYVYCSNPRYRYTRRRYDTPRDLAEFVRTR